MPTTEPRAQNGFAVVGLGKMGIMHAAMLGVVPGGKVAALVDANDKLARQVQSMGIDAPTFTDLEACLDQVRPEGVWLATPQFTHRALLETCLARRVPVFCEKPLAHTLADARAMAAAAARHPEVPVAVGFMLGHNPLFTRAAELLQGGALGTLRSFTAHCRLSQVFAPQHGWTFTREKAGGGVLINSGCHLLFVLDQLFGPPASVFCRARGVHNDVEDTLTAILEYENGLFGTLEVTWSVPGHEMQTHDVEVTGTAGVLEIGNLWLRLWMAKPQPTYPMGWSTWSRAELPPHAAFNLSPDYCGDEFYLEDADFVEAVRRQHAPRVGPEPALRVQEVVEALYHSAQSGQRVMLKEVSA